MPAADLGVLPIAGVEVQPAPSRSPSLSPLPDAADTTGPPNLGAAPHQLDSLHPVHPKGNQSWIFMGRTDAEAETPILWPADTKN